MKTFFFIICLFIFQITFSTSKSNLSEKFINKTPISTETLKNNFKEIWNLLGNGNFDFEIEVDDAVYDLRKYAFIRYCRIKTIEEIKFYIGFDTYSGEVLFLENSVLQNKEKLKYSTKEIEIQNDLFFNKLKKFVDKKEFTEKVKQNEYKTEWKRKLKKYIYKNDYIELQCYPPNRFYYEKFKFSKPCINTKINISKVKAYKIAFKFKDRLIEEEKVKDRLDCKEILLHIVNEKKSEKFEEDIHESRLAYEIYFVAPYDITPFSSEHRIDSLRVYVDAETGEIFQHRAGIWK